VTLKENRNENKESEDAIMLLVKTGCVFNAFKSRDKVYPYKGLHFELLHFVIGFWFSFGVEIVFQSS
jgi:hypothetical protein